MEATIMNTARFSFLCRVCGILICAVMAQGLSPVYAAEEGAVGVWRITYVGGQRERSGRLIVTKTEDGALFGSVG
jgi:hypothetical protein